MILTCEDWSGITHGWYALTLHRFSPVLHLTAHGVTPPLGDDRIVSMWG